MGYHRAFENTQNHSLLILFHGDKTPSSPPTDAEVDAAIAELASKADAAACQGGQNSDYIAITACIEWALGCESTVDWIPYWVSFADTWEKRDA